MYQIRLPLAYYSKVDTHGDKFLLSTFRKVIKSIKEQVPIFLGHKLQMKHLSGGAKDFKIDTRHKALTALISVTPEAETVLKSGGIARLTGVVLHAKRQDNIRTISEFKIFEVIILPKGLDVYDRTKKSGKTIKRLLTDKKNSKRARQ